jgi:hypothetical protein
MSYLGRPSCSSPIVFIVSVIYSVVTFEQIGPFHGDIAA